MGALMSSSLSWLDYSDTERRRVLDVVRSLSEKDTRDELGLATVRDALADLLAPGVSTIQTRARYFLFIPWIYQQIESRVGKRRGQVTKDWVARKARNAEVDLIGHLLESEDSRGTIGSWSGKSLKRLPSSVYWNGLSEWRIRLCPWSLDSYHHRLAVHGPPEVGDGMDGGWPNWRPGLPLPPNGFPEGTSMQLRLEEAEYLRDRILETHPNSLLGQLALGTSGAFDVESPWEVLDLGVDLPPDVANNVRHAREFSLAMHGAVLVYNVMLAEALAEPNPEWVDHYRSMLAEWSDEIMARSNEFSSWDRSDFWRTVARTRSNVPVGSRQFINSWLDRLLAADDASSLADHPKVRYLIDNRERQLKKAQARLHNPRLLELWNGETGSGTARMNYRWPVMRDHLADIHEALDHQSEARSA